MSFSYSAQRVECECEISCLCAPVSAYGLNLDGRVELRFAVWVYPGFTAFTGDTTRPRGVLGRNGVVTLDRPPGRNEGQSFKKMLFKKNSNCFLLRKIGQWDSQNADLTLCLLASAAQKIINFHCLICINQFIPVFLKVAKVMNGHRIKLQLLSGHNGQ